MDSHRVYALLLAAGASRRMGSSENKVLLPLGESSVLSYSLRALEHSPQIGAVYVAIRRGDEPLIKAEIDRWSAGKAKGRIVLGGEERFHSVRNGLEAMAAAEPPDFVLIHDGARPFLDQDLIRTSVEAAAEFGAAVVGHPMADTAKETDGAGHKPLVVRTLSRCLLWQVQTPQVFRFSLIVKAYRGWDQSRGIPTDDAAAAEAAGHQVRLVPGHRYNLKITTDLDLRVARALVEQRIWSVP